MSGTGPSSGSGFMSTGAGVPASAAALQFTPASPGMIGATSGRGARRLFFSEPSEEEEEDPVEGAA